MNISDEPPLGSAAYLAGLIRLWTITTEAGLVWCASLEEVGSGQRLMFASPQLLFDYLQRQMELLRSTWPDQLPPED